MAFSDPIVAGTELIREAIRSPNYQPGLAGWSINADGTVDISGLTARGTLQSANYDPTAEDGIIGWSINDDGSAVFSDVTIGGEGFFVDSDGNAAFADVVVNGELVYQGTPLGDLLAQLPKGMLFWGAANTISAAANSATEVAFLELDTVLEHGRMYRVRTSTILINGTVVGDIATIRLRDGGSSSPTTASNLLTRANGRIDTANASQNDVELEFTFACNDDVSTSASVLHSGEHRFGFTLSRPTGTGSVSLTTSSGTINPVTVYLEDLGPLLENTGQQFSSGGGGGNPVLKTYTKTYSAEWSRSWNSNGSTIKVTNGEISQGQYSGSSGNQVSWVGFDFASMQSDLSGATVKKVEFYLYFDHWYSFAGGTAVIGTHSSTATSAPTYNGSLDDQDRKRVSGWAINAGKWVDMTSVVGSEFKTGTSTGIVIGVGPTTATTYYGKARGNTEANEPKIRITYVK